MTIITEWLLKIVRTSLYRGDRLTQANEEAGSCRSGDCRFPDQMRWTRADVNRGPDGRVFQASSSAKRPTFEM